MLGEKIKKLRTTNSLTQKDLAEKLFVTAQAVSRWENNETGECQFFYAINSLTQEQQLKYLNVKAVEKRMSAAHDMEATIKGLEFLLSKI